MEYKLDLGAWNSVFAVPCALVDRHLKLAGKEQLQAILWILRRAGGPFQPREMAEALGMTEDSALDALEYWTAQGLLSAREGDLYPLPQQEDAGPVRAARTQPAAEAETTPAPQPDEPGAKKLPPKKKMAKPDAAYLAARVAQSEKIRHLLQEAEAAFGILSPAMTATLLASCDDYGLPAEVVAMLLHYAKDVGKTSTAYIDSVARDWAQNGIFTLEAAEAKLQELSEKRLAWGRVSSAAGLAKRSPSKKEEEFAYRWVNEWKFSQDMLTAAYERCVDHTGKFSASYMDKVLGRWEKEGVKNLAQLERSESQKKQDTQKNKSYDIDEIEDMSFFNLPEEL